MERLILHLGVHRTGSTSIQELLTRRRAELLARGITSFTRRDLMAVPERRALLSLPTSRTLPFAALSSLLAIETPTLVVSEENLLGTMPGVDGVELYPSAHRVGHTLRYLNRVFQVHVRVVLRRQDRWLESIYAFRVSRGFTASFPMFMKAFSRSSLSFRPLVQELRHARVSDLRVALFEDLFDQASDWDLGAFIGLPRDLDWLRSKSVTTNVGLRGPILNVVRFFNLQRPHDTVESQRRLVRALVPVREPSYEAVYGALERGALFEHAALLDRALSFASAEPPPAFSDEQRRAFIGRLFADNARLLSEMNTVSDVRVWDP